MKLVVGNAFRDPEVLDGPSRRDYVLQLGFERTLRGITSESVTRLCEFPLMPDSTSLRNFEAALQAADPQDAILFQSLLVEGTELLSLQLRTVAEQFGVSPASVTRWRQGKSAPHPALRPVIYKWLQRRASEARRLIDRRKSPGAALPSDPQVLGSAKKSRGRIKAWKVGVQQAS